MADENTGNEEKEVTTGEETQVPPTEKEEEKEAPKMVPLAALEDERRKRQELEARVNAQPEQQEKYFSDESENKVFGEFLKNPSQVTQDFNIEIRKLSRVIPDDGAEEYRAARDRIAYLEGTRQSFILKKMEISESRRESEVADTKILSQLGQEAAAILDYGRELGFSSKELKARPEILAIVKDKYILAHADEIAARKETKTPTKTAKTSGEAGGGGGGTNEEEDELNLSVNERIARAEKRAGGG
jgi:hypothetical protein